MGFYHKSVIIHLQYLSNIFNFQYQNCSVSSFFYCNCTNYIKLIHFFVQLNNSNVYNNKYYYYYYYTRSATIAWERVIHMHMHPISSKAPGCIKLTHMERQKRKRKQQKTKLVHKSYFSNI